MGTTASDIICACPQEMGESWCNYTANDCGVGSFWSLGIVVNDDTASELANGASEMGHVKSWDDSDLFGDWEAFSTEEIDDHCNDCVGPKEIDEFFRKQQFGKCFDESITARWCKGCDDETAIEYTFGKTNMLRQNQYEQRAMCTLLGLFAAEQAGNGMAANDSIITDLTADPYGMGVRGSRLNMIKAMGEKDCQELDGIMMHPVAYTNKVCEGFEECPCDTDGIRSSFLRGPNGERYFRAPKRLKDKLDLGGGNYLNIGYRNGLIKYGEGCVDNPVNRFYDNCKKKWFIDLQNKIVLHPCGFSWLDTNVTAAGLAAADLEAAANWERKADCEASGLHFFITNEA